MPEKRTRTLRGCKEKEIYNRKNYEKLQRQQEQNTSTGNLLKETSSLSSHEKFNTFLFKIGNKQNEECVICGSPKDDK